VARTVESFMIPYCCNKPMLLAGEPKYLNGLGYIDPVDNLINGGHALYHFNDFDN